MLNVPKQKNKVKHEVQSLFLTLETAVFWSYHMVFIYCFLNCCFQGQQWTLNICFWANMLMNQSPKF